MISEEFEKELKQRLGEIRPADRKSMEAAAAHWKTVGKTAEQPRKAGRCSCPHGGDQRNSRLYDQEKRSCHYVR